MTQPNLVLVEIDDIDANRVTNIVGLTDVIVLDWGSIRTNSSLSTEEALVAIAKLKLQLYPWQEQITRIWADLLEIESEWLDGAASDANLTYAYGRNDA